MKEFDLIKKKDNSFEVKLFIYETIEEIVCKYDNVEDINDIESIGGFDGDGKEYELSIDEYVESIRNFGCWGFCNDKKEMHLWYSDKVGIGELIQFFAHEMGHINEPHKENIEEEEIKAEKYAQTAIFAYDISKSLLNNG